jgi:hypothetical protein
MRFRLVFENNSERYKFWAFCPVVPPLVSGVTAENKAKILTINLSWYMDGCMNDLDIYVSPMLYNWDLIDFFDKL